MVTFRVVMFHVLRYRSTQRRLPYEDHPIQTLLLDRANEALGTWVQIRRSRRQPDDLRPSIPYQPAKLLRILAVAVDDQVALPA